jgi:S1-C subfamily serine protease
MRRSISWKIWEKIAAPSALGIIGVLVFLVAFRQGDTTIAMAAERADPLSAVVTVTSKVPANARTARVLGTQRKGNGVLIGDDGLVLTIGYLILEASELNVVDANGKSVPAKFVAYDHATGFGLLRATGPLGVKPAKFGKSAALSEADYVVPRPAAARTTPRWRW